MIFFLRESGADLQTHHNPPGEQRADVSEENENMLNIRGVNGRLVINSLLRKNSKSSPAALLLLHCLFLSLSFLWGSFMPSLRSDEQKEVWSSRPVISSPTSILHPLDLMYACIPNSPYSDLDASPSDPHLEHELYDYHMLDKPILFMFWGALSTCIENVSRLFFLFFFYCRLRHEASRLFTISSLCCRANSA